MSSFRITPNMVVLIGSHLADGTFLPKDGDVLSGRRRIHAGVPLGSLLWPVRFIFYTSDIPSGYQAALQGAILLYAVGYKKSVNDLCGWASK